MKVINQIRARRENKMRLYKRYTKEIKTLHLLSQIIGKVKLEYAVQEPLWAHVMLPITARGFSTGLLTVNKDYFEIFVDLIRNQILIQTEENDRTIMLSKSCLVMEKQLANIIMR